MSELAQFDSFLGGSHELPSTVNLMRFTAARSKEVLAMKNSLSVTKGTKLVFQKLPKHMRRRVMSHNAKRLPRRLREIHLNQLKKSGMPPKQKQPSRKHRRRHKNLLEEYSRRQRKQIWLETHIWHAKRFHMVSKWGYRLPESPCDKAFRACYRATAKHCLLQDISYYSCIEIEGLLDDLIICLKTVSESSNGLNMWAKAFINGNRQGETVLFHKTKAVGPVYFQWKPECSSRRVLWIWIHAAYYEEALNTLNECFDSKKISLNELKASLNRFRLTGPLANIILQNVFKVVEVADVDWLNKYLEDHDSRQTYVEQINFWNSLKNISSTGQLSPHIILALVVSDPRFNFPKKRTKALPENTEEVAADILDLPQNCSSGLIWNAGVRDEVKQKKLSNATIAELRSQLLVPGTDLNVPGAPVPVMLIQRPGNRDDKLGYCSGWDIIVPSGWAQPTWLALIMWGARPGGLRETISMTYEMGFPSQFAPDTTAGELDEKTISEEYTKKYFRLPPKKRTNYNKFAIASPFAWPWKLLINEWSENSHNDFVVLRNVKQLKNIQDYLKKKQNLFDLKLSNDCLIPVRLKMLKKGKAREFSIICLPKGKDLQLEPKEPIKIDENQEIRKELRDAHKMLLKQLNRRRKHAKTEGKIVEVDTEVLLNYQKKMSELWLPQASSIRKSCSREIIGFVTKGDFSFLNGTGCSVGYITGGSLKALLINKQKNMVLVRNTDSRQYRLASVEVAF